ncbi:MAG: dTMP kinase, partial [Candidatus Thermoplasmatota archaeon]
MRGRFITFEGIDGSGKTTIARRVVEALRQSGYRVVLTTEPTDSWLGRAVKKSYDDDVGPFLEA